MGRYNEIKSRQRLPRVIAFVANAAGTALTGPDSLNVSMVDTGTGVKTITFNEPFVNTEYVAIVTTATADTVAQVSVTSKSVLVINTFDSTDGTTAKDAICHVLVMGTDSADKFNG